MAQLQAFRGIHYNPDRVNLDDVTTPPYDIISPREQRSFYERDPFNIIRLDLGKTFKDDDGAENRYTRSAAFFSNWLNQGVLQRDEEPALYVYRQTYTAMPRSAQTEMEAGGSGAEKSVTGLICLVKLEELGQGILPHEKTLSGPRTDRLSLLEACHAHFSPVFSVYADDSGAVHEILSEKTGPSPLLSTTDEHNMVHDVWPLTDKSDIAKIIETVKPKRLLIADGHHRYETSLKFSKMESQRDRAVESSGYLMMYLVDIANESIDVLPTHRLLALENFNFRQFLAGLPDDYAVSEPLGQDEVARPESDPAVLSFGLYADGAFVKIRADRDSLVASIADSHAPQWLRLDTALLQETLFGPVFKISSGDPRLRFTQNVSEAIRSVDEKQSSLAVFLQPTGIEQVIAVAEAGEKMPQKSTFFYPKPRSGLVINRIDARTF